MFIIISYCVLIVRYLILEVILSGITYYRIMEKHINIYSSLITYLNLRFIYRRISSFHYLCLAVLGFKGNLNVNVKYFYDSIATLLTDVTACIQK